MLPEQGSPEHCVYMSTCFIGLPLYHDLGKKGKTIRNGKPISGCEGGELEEGIACDWE